MTPFTPGINHIYVVGKYFTKYFGRMKAERQAWPLCRFRWVERPMSDMEIIEEFRPEIRTLSELRSFVEEGIRRDATPSIFYVKDAKGILRSVSVRWFSSHGWFIGAHEIDEEYLWKDGVVFV